jgi:hypothetical protein
VRISNVLALLAAALPLCAAAGAIEKKQVKDIDLAALTTETQRTAYEGGVHLAWWIPAEYWDATLARDARVTDKDRAEFMQTLRGYSLLAVVQAEASATGAFTFYPRDVISKGLKLELAAGNSWTAAAPLPDVPAELAPLLAALSPILAQAMGPLGKNMNFYVLDDRKKEGRLISPYDPGALRITLADKNGAVLEPMLIEFPLDSLYVPRRCPNGKPAHVSWVVCPWDGAKLP